MKIEKKQATPVAASKYDESRKYIRCAIDSLGKIAKDDPVAREAIANLGVVCLDLGK